MVSLAALWLPILLSAVVVFVTSSVIHMALPWHKADFAKFPAEADVLDALRRFDLAPGDYAAPRAESMAEMGTDEFRAKIIRGPQVMLTVMRPGNSMGRSLAIWFVYLIVVGLFAGYVASVALGAGADTMRVFRITSTVAFAGYALALWQSWIWYSRNVGYAIRSTIDGLVYALLTGGVFGWLWP
jgi:hypothetical protein